ncbi:TetR/AcrR family transcriptional regulator [Winogradskya humida]|uniref:TetR family transcriptional regulator n=1 Tax=Winogradskya humida TaxID=113566 RepID=A0ABQ3ZSJ6_9ACTN|nr:TetR/AcrR family transcriptional regulator C-terminal domain-containing protein [Actinoplanes humidus]GIE21534.1 TetR family transcriptional regulator [Actinoplanes humidus]
MDQAPVWLRRRSTGVGRPAERSQEEVTAAAIELADLDGLVAVSMRGVAGRLGTGAASLYRYVSGRDDLLDLMIDEVAAGYELPPPTGPWLPGLVEVGRQARALMLRHPWLPELVLTRPVIGPHGVDLLEHVLALLADHPAAPARKLEAFAVMNATTAAFALNELGAAERPAHGAGDAVRAARPARAAGRPDAYLAHAMAAGGHPHLTAALAGMTPTAVNSGDRFESVLADVLTGLLGPA